jgi:SAM-dependent methyltransferase
MFKKANKLALFILTYFGVYPKQFWANISGIYWYLSDLKKIKAQFKLNYPNWRFKYFPILTDKTDFSGKGRGQYFYQDLYVANLIYKARPERHIDIGSRIDGFVAHVASFRQVDVFDIRPLKENLLNINFVVADLMNPNFGHFESTDSLSCLHTIEHFGLGRYSDPIDVDGHIKGLENMYKILKKGGLFYFSTQIGSPRLEFNAHRVFSMQYLLDLFEGKYEIVEFAYIDDNDNFFSKVSLKAENISTNMGCKLGCGIFTLRKI